MWYRADSCETEEYHVGHNSLVWDKPVSCGTELSQTSLVWDKLGSYGTELSHKGQTSVMWDKTVS